MEKGSSSMFAFAAILARFHKAQWNLSPGAARYRVATRFLLRFGHQFGQDIFGGLGDFPSRRRLRKRARPNLKTTYFLECPDERLNSSSAVDVSPVSV